MNYEQVQLPTKKRSIIPRLVGYGLGIIWLVVCVLVACSEYRVIKEAQRVAQEQQQLKLERQRRQAAYERRVLEEKAARSGVQNAIDGVKR